MSTEMGRRWETGKGRKKRKCEGLYRGKQWCHWLTIAGCERPSPLLNVKLRWLMLEKVFIINFSISYMSLCIASVCVCCFESAGAGFFELDLPICLFSGPPFLLLLSFLHLLCSVLLTSVDQSITPPPFVLWSRPIWAQVRVHMCAYRRVKTSTLRRAALTSADW